MAQQGLKDRAAAAQLLHAVLFDGRMISDAMDGLKDLSGPERARAVSLAQMVLRNLSPLDAVLETFLKKQPPLAVMNILRVCAVEILIDGIAVHGAVDSAVNLVKSKRKIAHLSGLTNAVARKISREGADILAAQAPQRLPSQIRKQLIIDLGEEATVAIEHAHASPAPTDLIFKPGLDQAQVGGQALPNGSVRLEKSTQITALPGYDSGEWWVQDAAASIPAKVLGAKTGDTVLDMCAAPGGKTMQLAAAGAKVTALDNSKARLEVLRENLKRTKLDATIVTADAQKYAPEAPFDAILLDAPCSASGTIRRHPEWPFLRKELHLNRLSDLQRALAKKAAEWVKPGGHLVYATCSLFAAEGEDQAGWFLQNADDFQAVPIEPAPFGLPPEAATPEGFLRLRPDFWADWGGMDGFFVAKFQRRA